MYAPLPFPRNVGPFTFSKGYRPIYLFLGMQAHLPFPRDVGNVHTGPDKFSTGWKCVRLGVRLLRRLAVQSSVWTERKY